MSREKHFYKITPPPDSLSSRERNRQALSGALFELQACVTQGHPQKAGRLYGLAF